MWIETTIAMRFLRQGRGQSLLILFGIAVGVSVIVFVTALISGLQATELAEQFAAHLGFTLAD